MVEKSESEDVQLMQSENDLCKKSKHDCEVLLE